MANEMEPPEERQMTGKKIYIAEIKDIIPHNLHTGVEIKIES